MLLIVIGVLLLLLRARSAIGPVVVPGRLRRGQGTHRCMPLHRVIHVPP
ncbi:hypothetical protein SAMN04488103_10637 [Gemmobacter aquatilis]|uniref:Uncharacterized protein n=1 Tax=Gemmobacter aquatilis TaxID=933059 RepID=A0A1H8HTY5_9RHOB|nr:hypothetical protein [Gemmobacter aquatilis]SEN59366.1 hypothetical protein SAMN04488103_10637 [Gemmobacter aquatilis]